MSELREQFSVVFLGDQKPPKKLILLRRALGRYGGDLCTGIGGHRNPKIDNTIKDTAVRELGEEVPAYAGVSLIEFARAVINGKKGLAYYWGLVDITGELPKVEGDEGVLELVPVEALVDQNIFPTTIPVLREWEVRKFRTDRSWTMYISGEEDAKGVTRNVVVDRIVEGLLDF